MRASRTVGWSHDPQPDLESKPSPRRHLQFSFASLLKLVFVAALLTAWWVDRQELRKQLRKTEDSLFVFQQAMGDETWADAFPYATGASGWVTSGPSVGGYPGMGSLGPMGPGAAGGMPIGGSTYLPLVGYTSGYTPPVYLNPNTPAPAVSDEVLRIGLYSLFVSCRSELERLFKEDRLWEEFLKTTVLPESPPAPSAEPPRVPAGPVDGGSQSVIPAGSNGPTPTRPAPAAPQPKSAPLDLQLYLPIVSKLLTGGSVEARRHAVGFLSSIGQAAQGAAVALSFAANDLDADVRRMAIQSLQMLGPKAQAAVPRLTELMNSSSTHEPLSVAALLAHIDPESGALTRLEEFLRDADSQVRVGAALQCMALGRDKAASALPALVEMLDDGDANVSIAAAQAISTVAPPAQAKTILINAMRREKNAPTRRFIARMVMRLENAPAE